MSYPLFYFLIVCKHTFSSFLLCSPRGISAPFSLPCPAQTYFSRFFSSFLLPAGHHCLFFSPMPRPALLFPLFLFFSAPGGASQPLFLSHAPFFLPCPAQSLISFKPLFSPAKVKILSSQSQLPLCYKILNPHSLFPLQIPFYPKSSTPVHRHCNRSVIPGAEPPCPSL